MASSADRPRPAAGVLATAMAVMAKAPLKGTVKTRLTPPLSETEAVLLSQSFLADVVLKIHLAARTLPIAPFLAFSPAGAEARFAGLVPPGTGFVLADGESVRKPGLSGIGRGLFQAAEGLKVLGFPSLCLVSADAPTLPVAALHEAAAALAAPGERLVLGPAEDGGYYLIGLKAPHPRLFADIAWSSASVCTATLARAAELGLPVVSLPPWYDVDDGPTLARLARALAAGSEEAPATSASLTRLGLIQAAAG